MSDAMGGNFGKFIPGFDFLQNLAKGGSETTPQMPNLGGWVAPTLNVEELDKRIAELKAVHFWLDQNSKALGATVQALEVQKMTLATLKGMNFNIADMANAFKFKPTEKAAPASKTISELAAEAQEARDAAAEPASAAGVAGLVDPLQLWGSLTQQFQQIATSAMKDVGSANAMDMTKNMASEFVKEAVSATQKVADSVAKSSTAVKAAAKSAVAKPAAKKTTKKAGE